ncbi:MAG: NAD-dependent DNA ligase LigA, partial [Candidatus Saccharimonadales bacterium]|nr:NAD-dependent DNA ligase LigA [Candidatus Saccharimonadales bacterium]
MTKEKAEKRISKLRDLISEYRYEYHVNNKSIMSEAAADGLKHELSQLEEQFPDLITPDSPTQRIAGQPLPEFTSVKHQSRMLSLNDVFDSDELEAWQDRILKLLDRESKQKLEYFVDFKMDGFSCSLVYEDGRLQRAITRGDGFVGEDITQNIRTLDSVPLKLRRSKGFERLLQGRTEVRGEVLMYKQDFEELNIARKAAGEPEFKNPRNTAAGTMRQLDSMLVSQRKMHFHGFDMLRSDETELDSYNTVYKSLRAIGIITNQNAGVLSSLKEVKSFADRWEEKRHQLPYGTDG